MAKDAYYFSHDSNARNDLKMIKLRRKLGLKGIGLFWCTIEMLRETDDYSIPLTEIEDICFDLRCEVDEFNILFECELLEKNDDFFTSSSLCKRMEKLDEIKEKRRIAGAKGGKSKASVKQLLSNKSKVKQSKEENSKEEELINSIYSIYPSKCPIKKSSTGKTSSNKTKIKSMLQNMSADELKSIIKRYIAECTESKTFIKNFSTFLNNIPDYSEPSELEIKPKVKFQ